MVRDSGLYTAAMIILPRPCPLPITCRCSGLCVGFGLATTAGKADGSGSNPFKTVSALASAGFRPRVGMYRSRLSWLGRSGLLCLHSRCLRLLLVCRCALLWRCRRRLGRYCCWYGRRRLGRRCCWCGRGRLGRYCRWCGRGRLGRRCRWCGCRCLGRCCCWYGRGRLGRRCCWCGCRWNGAFRRALRCRFRYVCLQRIRCRCCGKCLPERTVPYGLCLRLPVSPTVAAGHQDAGHHGQRYNYSYQFSDILLHVIMFPFLFFETAKSILLSIQLARLLQDFFSGQILLRISRDRFHQTIHRISIRLNNAYCLF